MAFDQGLAERLRELLAEVSDVEEKRMFGGLAMLVGGKMCCGVIAERLMLRVGPDAYASALAQPHVSEMDFTGKPLRGFVYVAPEGFEDDADLRRWVMQALAFVRGLPPRS